MSVYDVCLISLPRLPGDRLTAVTEDGSSAGDRFIVIWNPSQRKIDAFEPVFSSDSMNEEEGGFQPKRKNTADEQATTTYREQEEHTRPVENVIADEVVACERLSVVKRRSTSAILEIGLLLSALVKMNIKTLAFCKVSFDLS